MTSLRVYMRSLPRYYGFVMLKRLISIVLVLVWTLSQTAMLHAHTFGGQEGWCGSSASGHSDTAGVAHAHDHGDSGAGHQDHGNPMLECCSATCVADAQRADCHMKVAERMRIFDAMPSRQLTAADLKLTTPPPNPTV